jgi:hypothetical protein
MLVLVLVLVLVPRAFPPFAPVKRVRGVGGEGAMASMP